MEDEDLISLAESTWLIEKIGAEEWKEHFFFLFSGLFVFLPPASRGFCRRCQGSRRGEEALLVRLIGPRTRCQGGGRGRGEVQGWGRRP